MRCLSPQTARQLFVLCLHAPLTLALSPKGTEHSRAA
jgi:hypothetical protein